MRHRLLLPGLCLGPLLLLGAAAATLLLLGRGGAVLLRIPLPSLLLTTGLLASAVLVLLLLVRPRRAARQAARRERELAQVRAQEQENHRRFLRRLDHELKNPVTAIRSALAAGDPLPAANVQIAAGQARRVGDLVGQLRALSSLETREIEREEVAIGPLLEEEVSALAEENAARGLRRELRTALPTVPWPLPEVVGDGDLLRVMIRNLLVNAVKYSEDGAVIDVRGSAAEGTVTLEIADTGRGIRAEDLPHVWEELWRAAEARGSEGTGLGLSLVRVIVARHGGEAHISSVLGRGTLVRIRLPAAASPAAP
ncbi:sensor histidine kinase [Brachybacterium hainanense]|uniref:histidine kinase n=1 Tax=Brachybacterium hainanense TaxID=1541174 RepID=A0ABV6RAI3_9MICO